MIKFHVLSIQDVLNDFMALGRAAWKETRASLQALLSSNDSALLSNVSLRQK